MAFVFVGRMMGCVRIEVSSRVHSEKNYQSKYPEGKPVCKARKSSERRKLGLEMAILIIHSIGAISVVAAAVSGGRGDSRPGRSFIWRPPFPAPFSPLPIVLGGSGGARDERGSLQTDRD